MRPVTLFVLFTSCILLLSGKCMAQETKPWSGFGIEANFFEGKVIKHTKNFHLPIPETSTGLDLNFQLKTYGRREWEQRRRYPVVGVGLTYTNYSIDSIYGRCFSIFPNVLIPLVTGNKFEWTIRIGDGAGFVTRDFSRTQPVDTVNNAIGSHLNDYASFLMDLRYHVNHHWDIQAGMNFSHISNASFHQPNLGINLYGYHVGLKYFPVTSTPKRIERNLKPLRSRYLAEFRLSLAFTQPPPPLGPLYPVYLGTGFISKRWISKNKVFAGIDFSYHESIYTFLRNNEIFPGSEAQHSYKSAVIAGNEFLLGRVGVVLQVGYYVVKGELSQGKYYQKLGGNFYLVQREHGPIKELFLCAFLKTHLTVAELAEFGFGMGF
jgi:hypothetical protein